MNTSNTEPSNSSQFVPLNSIQASPSDERISTSEMSQLWIIYLSNSMLQRQFEYFAASAQDPDIKNILTEALNSTNLQLAEITRIFNTVSFPIPYGFTAEDVNTKAQRLYCDAFMLNYFRTITSFGVIKLGHALPMAVRSDIRTYFHNALITARNLFKASDDLALKKGLLVKPPYTSVPKQVTYADKDFFGSILGKHRPMNILELAFMFQHLNTKYQKKALLKGFAQTARSPKVKECLAKGTDVIDKVIERWRSILVQEGMPEPYNWEKEVLDSSEPPFSDKLMMFNLTVIVSFAVTSNIVAIANVNRKDLLLDFSQTVLNLQLLGKEAIELMLENGWFEQIPLVTDREELANLRH